MSTDTQAAQNGYGAVDPATFLADEGDGMTSLAEDEAAQAMAQFDSGAGDNNPRRNETADVKDRAHAQAKADAAAQAHAKHLEDEAWQQQLKATPPPTRGWPAIKWLLWGKSKHVIPTPNKRELTERALKREQEHYDTQVANALEMIEQAFKFNRATINGETVVWEGMRMIVSDHNQSGGVGKTTIISGMSRVAAQCKVPTLVITFTENDGATARQLGIEDESTLSPAELFTLLWQETERGTVKASAETIRSNLRNRDQVYITRQDALPDWFHGDHLDWMLDQLVDIFPLIFMDGGNAIARRRNVGGRQLPKWESNAELRAGTRSDVMIFVVNADAPKSHVDIGKSMDAFVLIANDPRQYEKLSRSIVVINQFKPGEHNLDRLVNIIENFVDSQGNPLRPRAVPIRVRDRGANKAPSKLILIDHDKEIQTRQVLDLAAISAHNRGQFAIMLYEAVMRAAVHQGRDLTTLQRILSMGNQGYNPAASPFLAPPPEVHTDITEEITTDEDPFAVDQPASSPDTPSDETQSNQSASS